MEINLLLDYYKIQKLIIIFKKIINKYGFFFGFKNIVCYWSDDRSICDN